MIFSFFEWFFSRFCNLRNTHKTRDNTTATEECADKNNERRPDRERGEMCREVFEKIKNKFQVSEFI